MIRKTLLIAVAGAMLPAVVKAQEENASLERRIEVTRQYMPEVEGARKIDFPPRMQDTVTLKPDIKYSITPTPWKSVFGTTPIAPVAISTAEYKPFKPLYLMLGGGYPAQSAVDLYAAFPTRGDVRAGVYVNHYGQWSKLKNDAGVPKDAKWTENRIGVYAGRDFGRRTLDFDFKGIFNYYAPFDKVQTGCIEPPGTMLFMLDASLKFGDTFTDLSRFNYRFGINAGTWFDGFTEYGKALVGNAFADFGWKAGKGAILAGVSFDVWRADSEHDWYASIVPEYRLSSGRWSLAAGLKLYYNVFNLSGFRDAFEDLYADGDHVYVLPKIHVSYEVAAAFVPYITLDGNIGSGAYPALSGMNPYSAGNTARPKSAELRGGFRGGVSSALAYDAYAGYMIAELPYFVKAPDDVLALFFPALAPVNMFYAGLGVEFKLPFGLSLEGGLRYNSYNNSGNFWSNAGGRVGMGIPAITVSGDVKYQYRDRLFISAGAEFIGKRHFASSRDLWIEAPSSVNLKAQVEYKTGSRLSVFLKGDNLLNSRIYRYLDYPALGINVLAGVKMVF